VIFAAFLLFAIIPGMSHAASGQIRPSSLDQPLGDTADRDRFDLAIGWRRASGPAPAGRCDPKAAAPPSRLRRRAQALGQPRSSRPASSKPCANKWLNPEIGDNLRHHGVHDGERHAQDDVCCGGHCRRRVRMRTSFGKSLSRTSSGAPGRPAKEPSATATKRRSCCRQRLCRTAGSCAVDYLNETPSPKGSTYSARLLCPGTGAKPQKP
jgi:hypothetical protein